MTGRRGGNREPQQTDAEVLESLDVDTSEVMDSLTFPEDDERPKQNPPRVIWRKRDGDGNKIVLRPGARKSAGAGKCWYW